VLRGPKVKDLKPVFDVHTDPDVMRFYGVIPYDSMDKAQKHLDWLASLHREKKGLRWVITLKNEDTYIGDVGFDNYEKKHDRAEVGYILGKDYWGRGIMSEAIAAALRHGFHEMNLNRVQAHIDPRNMVSRRIVVKQAFKLEGSLREYVYEYGEHIDLDVYSLLKREYRLF